MHLEDIPTLPTFLIQTYLVKYKEKLEGALATLPMVKEVDGDYYNDKVYEYEGWITLLEDELETRYFENNPHI